MFAFLQKAEAGPVQLRERGHAAEQFPEQQLYAGEVAQGGAEDRGVQREELLMRVEWPLILSWAPRAGANQKCIFTRSLSLFIPSHNVKPCDQSEPIYNQ